MLRFISVAAAVLAVGCASSARPTATVVVTRPLPLYASALEEAIGRYEVEVYAAVASAQTISHQRYEALLDASLRARGLTREGLRELALRQPRFYFTQQALYAERMERLQTAARSIAPTDGALASH